MTDDNQPPETDETPAPDGAADAAGHDVPGGEGERVEIAPTKVQAPELAIRAAVGDAQIIGGFKAVSVEEFNEKYAVVILGGKTLIMRERGANAPPEEEPFSLMSEGAFKLAHKPNRVRVEYMGESRFVACADIWLNSPQRRQYEGICFAPAPYGQDRTPWGYYNLWRGFAVAPDPRGDAVCSRFLAHIWDNVAQENAEIYDWIIAFFARLVQQPHDSAGVSLILRGKQGVGKSTLGDIIGHLFMDNYLLVDQDRYVTGSFNAHMQNVLLLQADEAVFAGDKAAESRLKGLITAKFHMVERKGVDPIRCANHVHLLMTTNNEWAVPAGLEERRFCVIDVGEAMMQDHNYFAAIYREMLEEGGLAGLLHHLMHFDLASVDLKAIPQTEALFEQKVRGMRPEQGWWFDRVYHADPETWPDVEPKQKIHTEYCAFVDRLGGNRYKASPTELGIQMQKMLPWVVTVKRTWRPDDDPGAGQRVNHYKFPSLQECRDKWDSLMGPVEWPSLAEEGDYAA